MSWRNQNTAVLKKTVGTMVWWSTTNLVFSSLSLLFSPLLSHFFQSLFSSGHQNPKNHQEILISSSLLTISILLIISITIFVSGHLQISYLQKKIIAIIHLFSFLKSRIQKIIAILNHQSLLLSLKSISSSSSHFRDVVFQIGRAHV